MFGQPREPLKEFLKARHAAVALRSPGAVPAPARAFWSWCLVHWDSLHHAWVYGLAFGVSLLVFNPSFGWVNLVIIPVQVVFLGALIAVVELPTMLLLVTMWSVIAALVGRLR